MGNTPDAEQEKIVSFSDYVCVLAEKTNSTVDTKEVPALDEPILQLPAELVNYKNINFLASFLLVAIGVVIAFYVKDWRQALLFALFSGFFAVRGVNVRKNYATSVVRHLQINYVYAIVFGAFPCHPHTRI